VDAISRHQLQYPIDSDGVVLQLNLTSPNRAPLTAGSLSGPFTMKLGAQAPSRSVANEARILIFIVAEHMVICTTQELIGTERCLGDL
jgi:hypothetical protein